MDTVWLVTGVVVLGAVLLDIFLTALNYDEAGFLSGRLTRLQWRLLRNVTRRLPRRWRPVALRQVTGLQVILLVVFALRVRPAHDPPPGPRGRARGRRRDRGAGRGPHPDAPGLVGGAQHAEHQRHGAARRARRPAPVVTTGRQEAAGGLDDGRPRVAARADPGGQDDRAARTGRAALAPSLRRRPALRGRRPPGRRGGRARGVRQDEPRRGLGRLRRAAGRVGDVRPAGPGAGAGDARPGRRGRPRVPQHP